jgi:endonuclease G, mitochondrial
MPARAGSVRRPARFYDGRTGYDPDFLGVTVPLPALTERARRFGDPAPVAGTDDHVLRYTHFSVVLNAGRRLAFYTAVNIDGSRWLNLERGDDVWYYDPRLPLEVQIGDELYGNEPGGPAGKGWFDRGHLVRRLDPVWGTLDVASLANDDTFHWTNAAPQYWGFNQGQDLWQGLENFILYNTDEENVRACVFTGPIFQDDDEEHRGVLIPRYFWKVVAVTDGAGALYTSAYVVSQERYARNVPFERLPVGAFNNFQVRVASVARLTGLDFGDAVLAADVLPADADDRPLRGFGDIVHPRRGHGR